MKKRIIISLLGLGVITTLGIVINKNRKQSGIILNQQHTIDGLIKDIKNLSYHLGKRR